MAVKDYTAKVGLLKRTSGSTSTQRSSTGDGVENTCQHTSCGITGAASFMQPKEKKAIGTLLVLDHCLQWFREEFPFKAWIEAWILDKIDLVRDSMDMVQSIQAGSTCDIGDGLLRDFRVVAGFSSII